MLRDRPIAEEGVGEVGGACVGAGVLIGLLVGPQDALVVDTEGRNATGAEPSAFGLDQDDAVGAAGAVERRTGRPLQDIDALDVLGVETGQHRDPLTTDAEAIRRHRAGPADFVIVDAHPVDIDDGLAAAVEPRRGPHHEADAAADVARRRLDADAGYLPAQELREILIGILL